MPFFWLGLAAVIGAVVADWLRLPWWGYLVGFAFCAGGFLWQLLTKRLPKNKQLPLMIAAGVFCLSGFLYMLSLKPNTPDYVQYYLDAGKVELTGIVSTQPKKQQTNLAVFVEVSTIKLLESEKASQAKPVAGKVLLRLPLSANYAYGDSLQVQGELTEPSDGSDFSYRDYLGHRDVYTMMYYPWVEQLGQGNGNPVMTLIYQLSDYAKQIVDRLFSAPESGLLKGILLGDQSDIPPDLKHAYTLSGTAHIIAISGFNMAVLAAVISRMTKKLHLIPAGLITISVLAFYTILVGASASVVRAAIMSSYVILGRFIGRKGNLLNSLGVCVLAMVLLDPHAPWDVGFQLSVMATLGLSIYMSPLQARLSNWLFERFGEKVAEKLTAPIANTFLVTLVAQASVMPLLLYHFREVSPLFLLANPLVLPPQPALMVSALVALIVGMIWFPLGNLLKWIPWGLAWYTNQMVSFLANLIPEGLRIPRLDWLWVLLSYAVIAWLTLRPTRRGELKPVFHPIPAFTGLLVGIFVVWTTLGSAPDGKLHVRVLGKAKSPTVFLMAKNGETLLIGGAMSPGTLTEQVLSALPPFSLYLNAVVIPVCKQAEVKGLFGLEARLAIDTVYWACDHTRIQTTQRLYDSFAQAHIEQVELKPEELLSFGDNEKIYFEPDEQSNQSIRIEAGHLETLLAYDKYSPEYLSVFTILPEGVAFPENISPPPSDLNKSLEAASSIQNSKTNIMLMDISQFEWLEWAESSNELRISSNSLHLR
ncbi:MAG: ComEC/Rec2 family competence protein [Anaerolineaceae bacterium]